MKSSRRKFLQTTLKATALTTLGTPVILHAATDNLAEKVSAKPAFQFAQVSLPYAFNALEPHVDALTMDIHYNKHHTAYIKNVNESITLENINYSSEKDFFANTSKLSLKARNNGGGAWNHNFFWQVMRPNAGGTPSGKVLEAITASFGSFEKFKEQFSQAGITRFGSGWAWLVTDGKALKIGSTPNQDNPLMDISELKGKPILALDVWEHAYYLKYQNKRADYITSWWNIVNWDEVARQLS
ncbi:MAG: superoxide dismutase [Cyclobacteriaceae bacterium]|nr:superoxide dismutase [Cyclobacteriaceae bacterium]